LLKLNSRLHQIIEEVKVVAMDSVEEMVVEVGVEMVEEDVLEELEGWVV